MKEPTKLHQEAIDAVARIKASGHKHEQFGRVETIGNKECETCGPVIALAHKAEQEAKYITKANWIDPKIQPCEICGEEHQNYECCSDCNYDTHRCHFCGDDLGHSQVSVCYITED